METKEAKATRDDATLVARVTNTIKSKIGWVNPDTVPDVEALWKDDKAFASTEDLFKTQKDIIAAIILRLNDFAKAQSRNQERQLDSFMSVLMGRIEQALQNTDKTVAQEVAALRKVVLEMHETGVTANEITASILAGIKEKLGELYLEDEIDIAATGTPAAVIPAPITSVPDPELVHELNKVSS